ncbi:MAG TPA: 4a-hydroxytetrahydrobiopterin dehydratase [Steroidobacteraceae bacterium]|jgi:4a-hydroxytetrahydrobiopterin dehydratase|nr:4a-hydroxytetrahydrobiopterin dehydratase [Steroidobacteraceae bacterium]
MSELTSRKCVPCEGGVQPLTRAQAQDLMKQLQPEWKLAEDSKSIAAEWKFRNFFHTMSFVNALAHIANAEDHHPDVELGYGYCRIRYNTHAIGGLSENDFICAAKIDALPRT